MPASQSACFVKGFDPKTGKELWFCDGMGEQSRASPLYGKGIAVGLGSRGTWSVAVKLGGSGDITSAQLWRSPRSNWTGSGVIVGDHILTLQENGVPQCLELKTGEDVWKLTRPIGAGTWSSMVYADGRIYVLAKGGDTYVFAANPKYELLATNRLGNDITNASIAVSDGALYIRIAKSLWCISEKK